MNYGANHTLMEMDTKNRNSQMVAQARRERTPMNFEPTIPVNRIVPTVFSRLANAHATEMAASLIVGVIAICGVASAAILA